MRILFLLLIFIYGCNSGVSKSGANSTNEQEPAKLPPNGDYLLLKRFRLVDKQGFGTPVEAVSFLIPQNWKVESGINWNRTGCLTDMVQAQLKAVSEDGAFEFFVFPATQFDWSDSPEMLDAMQRGGAGSGCNLSTPLDASGYIREKLAGLVSARVSDTRSIEPVERALKEQAQTLLQAMPGYSQVPSASEGKLQFNDGKEGIALCTVNQVISTGPDLLRGGTFSHIQTVVNMRIVIKFNPGKEELARRILSTIQSSVRYNMVWANAIQTMFNNIRRQVQDETWKRIQISQRAQQEISDGIVRSWESNNEGRDKIGESWSQYIRGVESWNDGDNKIELVSGYSNAWKRNDGTYLLINDPSFDPNVGFNENWTQLTK